MQEQNAGPENQDSQHMLEQPRGYFPEITLTLRSWRPFTGVLRGLGWKVPHGVLFECLLGTWLGVLGRHLVGVWIGGVWNGHFPESEKYFSEAEISRKMPEIPQKERFSPNFRLRNLKFRARKNAIPYPQPFHTPTRLPPRSAPRSKSAKKHSKSAPWGTPSQVPKNTQKALCGALSGPALEHSCKWPPGSQHLHSHVLIILDLVSGCNLEEEEIGP